MTQSSFISVFRCSFSAVRRPAFHPSSSLIVSHPRPMGRLRVYFQPKQTLMMNR